MIAIKRKKRRIFGGHVDVNCDYCKHGSSFDGASVCQLGKNIEPDGTCRRFVYDPLRREPFAQPPLREYDPDEFKL